MMRSPSSRAESVESGDSLRARCLGALGAALAVAITPLACAHEPDPAAGPEPERSVQVPEASADDGGDAEASADAGSCSASHVCIAPAPIGEFINITSVWGSSKTDVWAVGTNGTVLHYDGNAWEAAARVDQDASLYTLRSVWLERPDDVWIVDGHRLRHSTGWKGPTATEWTFQELSLADATPAAIRGKGSFVWLARGAMGPGGGAPLLKLGAWADDGPSSVENVGPSYSYSLVALAVSGPDEVWATGFNSLVDDPGRVVRASLIIDDSGASEPSWQVEEHDSRSTRLLNGIWADESVVWLAGEGGTLRRMTRSAVSTKTFEMVESPVTSDLYGIFGFGPNDIWAVGDASTVLHWDGASWSKVATPFDGATDKPRLLSVWGSSPGDVWIAGHGTMLHFTENAP
jgi:hypothetical protein